METTLNSKSFIIAIWTGFFVLLGTMLLQNFDFTLPEFSFGSDNKVQRTTVEQPYDEHAMVSAINASLPSVVTVEISTTASNLSPYVLPKEYDMQIDSSIGSGFVVSDEGHVVTNKHVVAVEDAQYRIITSDKRHLEVIEIYRNPDNDLAILKVKDPDLKPLMLGNSHELQLGQQVVAIGTPLGEFANTVTAGIVSGLERGVVAETYRTGGNPESLEGVIQTDAAINLGNSGGPLINSRGEVIGVNTAVAAGGQNIGFAIPIDEVKALLSSRGIQ